MSSSSHNPVSASAGRIPSLDGIRGCCMILVLFLHLTGTQRFPVDVSTPDRVGYDLGYLAMRVFFIVSGFLITGLLLEEQRVYGSISLKRFYLRRTLRIFPAYYVFLVAMWILAWAGVVSIAPREFVNGFTYTVDYLRNPSWTIGHIWSLAVEEQFYLLWPAVVVFAGFRRARRTAAVVMLLVPVLRVILATVVPWYRELIGHSFETAADALAMGCFLAIARDDLFARSWYRRVIAARWIIPAIFLVGVGLSYYYRLTLLLGMPVTNVAIAMGLDQVVRNPDGRVPRVLGFGPLVYIGTVSYSIYVWQQPFLNRHSGAAMNVFPLNLALTLAAALTSFYLVERPFQRARSRMEHRLLGRRQRVAERTPPAPDLMPVP